MVWISVYGFSAYTSACAFRHYYNPLLLTLMCGAFLLGAIFLFPSDIGTWWEAEEKARSFDMKLPFVESARESLGLIISFLVNMVYLIKGYKGAKQEIPLYKKETEKPFE